MTREEQILEYANSFKWKGMESEELKEIIRIAIIDGAKWADNHPIKPSLPSNLDEAAEKYEHNLGYYECMNQWPSVAFKAGAEWMANEGEIFEGMVDNTLGYPTRIALGAYLTHYNTNDEVIVQIRKK